MLVEKGEVQPNLLIEVKQSCRTQAMRESCISKLMLPFMAELCRKVK
jgi:hypothetical protein